jgi:cytochrome c oxidase cbb3-type subunit 4
MAFDLNVLRIGVTLLSFAVFTGIVLWAWSRGRRGGFDGAAGLPFLDEATDMSQAAPRANTTLAQGAPRE